MNVALIGMMGTMKTSVGKVLAKKADMRFFDTDAEFVSREHCSINEAFEKKGETYFREREREIVAYAASLKDTVISCGGGVPLDKANVAALKTASTVVLLTASPERILERTSGNSSRPLLAGGGLERIKQLISERREAYAAAADFTVDTTDILPDVVSDIIMGLLFPKS